MKIELITYQERENKYWTYTLLINHVAWKPIPRIYRRYAKEKTAIDNGVKHLNKYLKQARP